MMHFQRFSIFSTTIVLFTIISVPNYVLADCKELRIVESDDGVEAVCVGEPLTPEQQKAMEAEQKKQEAEYKRQQASDEKRQKEVEMADAKKKAQEDAAQKKLEAKPQPPAKRTDNLDKSGISFR